MNNLQTGLCERDLLVPEPRGTLFYRYRDMTVGRTQIIYPIELFTIIAKSLAAGRLSVKRDLQGN